MSNHRRNMEKHTRNAYAISQLWMCGGRISLLQTLIHRRRAACLWNLYSIYREITSLDILRFHLKSMTRGREGK